MAQGPILWNLHLPIRGASGRKSSHKTHSWLHNPKHGWWSIVLHSFSRQPSQVLLTFYSSLPHFAYSCHGTFVLAIPLSQDSLLLEISLTCPLTSFSLWLKFLCSPDIPMPCVPRGLLICTLPVPGGQVSFCFTHLYLPVPNKLCPASTQSA